MRFGKQCWHAMVLNQELDSAEVCPHFFSIKRACESWILCMLDLVTRVVMLLMPETGYWIPLSSVYLSVNRVWCSIYLRDFQFLQFTEDLDEVTKLLPVKTKFAVLTHYVGLISALFFSKRKKVETGQQWLCFAMGIYFNANPTALRDFCHSFISAYQWSELYWILRNQSVVTQTARNTWKKN